MNLGQRNAAGLIFTILLLAPSGANATSELSGEEIIARYVAALGGQDSLQATKTLRLTGTQTFNGIESKVTIYRQRPNHFRMDVETDGGVVIEAFDGKTGWIQGSRRGTEGPALLDSEATQSLLDEVADFDGPLVGFAEKGHRVDWMGEVDVDGTKAHHLRISLASGKSQDWFLSSDDYTLLQKTTTQVHRRSGEYQRNWYYLEYETVGGLRFPFYLEREDRQHVRAITVEKVEINPSLPADIFSMPTASDAGGG